MTEGGEYRTGAYEIEATNNYVAAGLAATISE